MKELVNIQAEISCKKGQRNEFGGFKYRSLEDILASAKPVLSKYGCYIFFSDSIEVIEGARFIRSICTIGNEKGEVISSVAFAEMDSHKGMSKEQATGSASSYARKYAACSLLAIDDNQDVDSLNNAKEKESNLGNMSTVEKAIAALKGAQTMEELKTLWAKNKTLQLMPMYVEAKDARKAELTKLNK